MIVNKKKDLLVVCGPTASGKTSLAVRLASRYDGEIISADSRQVYKGMDIGTGKDLHEYSSAGVSIPFHLIDIADPSAIYTVYHFVNDFLKAFQKVSDKKRLPVLTGGTGLYIEAVLRGYQIPPVSENKELRLDLMKKEIEWLKQELKRKDPELFSRTDLSSKKRIVRSMEIAFSSKGHLIPEHKSAVIADPLVLCTQWERKILRERIDKRLAQRLENGMIEEVRMLLQSGIRRERFSLFGMEYKHVARYIDGEVSYGEMVDKLRHDIYHLAKRQETWFRGMEKRGIEIHWVKDADISRAVEICEEVIGDSG